jgi:hypothetical protein
MTENTGEIQGKFQKGQSGNPAGKPKGARHKTTLAVQALLDGEAENITRKAIEAAMAGDITAIRLVLERILPARKDSPITLELPAISNSSNVVELMQAVLDAVSNGEITPLEANALAGVVEQWRKTYETLEVKAKLDELKNLIAAGRG